MKKQILLSMFLCLTGMHMTFAQISNTETNITLTSGSGPGEQVCPWNDIPASDANNSYEMYVEFEDGDNFGVLKRLPAVGYYNCTVTKPPGGNGPNISIDVPGAAFPTINNTSLMWDLLQSKGTVGLRRTTSSGISTYFQIWEYNQYRCPALPIFISSFTYSALSDRIQFNWTAQDESDYLSHYILQRSSNNFHWTNEVLEPANTGLGTHNYTVYANKPGNNFTWYRLKWIDENGIARTTTSIQVFNTGNTATNIVCNYTNITGPSSLCAPQSAVFKLHNAPASGAAYSLSVNIGTITSTEQNGLKATVSYTYPAYPTNAVVYANSANSSCNKSKTVVVGGTGNFPLVVNMTWQSYFYTYYDVSIWNLWPGTTGSQYEWYRNGTYLTNASSWSFDVAPGPGDFIEAKVNTACGQATGSTYLYYQPLPPCDQPCEARMSPDKFKVMPVPANDVLTVSMRPDEPLFTGRRGGAVPITSHIYTLQIYDMFGNLKLERKNISLKTDQRLDISRLPVGNYVLYIQNAGNKISKQVRIQR